MTDADVGEWMIVHPAELMATFLLPLPDPIALKDGTALGTYRGMDHSRVKVVKPWLGEMWMQRTDGSEAVPCPEIFSQDESAVENWANKSALHTSIQFHETYSDAGLRLGLEPAIQIAKVISGAPLTLLEKREALDESSGHQFLESVELREMGMGAVTIAECVVGLHLAGGLPVLDSPLGPAGLLTGESPDQRNDSGLEGDEPTLWPWLMFEPGEAPPVDILERRLRVALDVVLTDLRSIQRGVHLMRRAPTAISTLERLPYVVPVVLRLAADIGRSVDHQREILFVTRPEAGPFPQFAPEPVPDDEMLAFNKSRQRADLGPFAAHNDVYREAHIALDRLGDHRLAVLLFGIAAESMFDELLLLLMWEEGSTPEDAAEGWTDGLPSRLRQHLAGRIGGSWDVTGRNPIGIWAQDVASPRHRVAHAAYLPTMAEAQKSFNGVNALVSHLCDRLATADVRRRYPRSALMLAGEDGLRRRNAYTKKLRVLERDPSEVLWAETFHRWHEAWRRTRQDLTASPRVADQSNADLLAVRYVDRSLRWILHDRTQHLATEVRVDENDLDAGLVGRFHLLADLHNERDGQKSAISFAVEQPMRSSVPPDARWVEEYQLLPLTEVMVDRSDHRQHSA